MSNFGKLMQQAAAGSAGGGDFYPYTIDNSALFENGHYLYRTPSAGNRKTYTISFWIKRTKVSADVPIIFSAVETSGVSEWYSAFDNTDQLRLYSGGSSYGVKTDAKYRDVSSWMHVVYRIDTTQATASNRCRVYVNGVDASDTVISPYSQPSQNTDTAWNKNSEHIIGWFYSISGAAYHGWYYLAEFIHVEGQSLDPTSFGQLKKGTWIPKQYTGSYGTNGFHLDFANSSNYGNDVSGNGNHFTQAGMGTQDTRIDTPTNNFPVLNNLMNWGPQYLQQGNLQAYNSTSAYWMPYQVTMAVPDTGKWYAEFKWISGSYAMFGLVDYIAGTDAASWAGSGTYWYYHIGRIYLEGTSYDGYSSFTTSDIISITIDRDNDEIIWRKNNSVVYTATSVNRSARFFAVNTLSSTQGINLGQNPRYGGNYAPSYSNSDANGYGSFVYAPPSGALALCAANLPQPTIGPNTSTQSDDHFNTVLYTGTGASRSVSVGFQPDFVWLKDRTTAYNHYLYDVIRGVGNALQSNSTNAEETGRTGLTSFDSGGFSLGSQAGDNASGDNFVSWNWKANGSGVSNTNGSITSTVSANTAAGFSIVTYTGTGTGAGYSTIGHGLSQSPEFVILKNRDSAANWYTYHVPGLGTPPLNAGLYLNSTSGNITSYTYPPWGAFTSTTIALNKQNSDIVGNGVKYVMYVFHSVEGFSKFGKYTGNGSTNGPFVYTGFRPAFVLLKAYTSGSVEGWRILDAERNTYNTVNRELIPGNSGTEGTLAAIDFLSNGFKLRESGSGWNYGSYSYIYMAFAENPFKYANAR